MYRKILVALPLLALAGCGSSSSSSTTTTTTAQGVAVVAGSSSTVLQTSVQLTNAVSGMQTTASAYKAGSTDPESLMFSDLTRVLAERHLNNLSAATTTAACSTGNMSVTYPDVSTSNPYVVAMTFNSCDDGAGDVQNGTVTVSVTSNADGSSSYSVTMGNGDTTFDASDYTITNAAYGYTFIYSMSVSGTDSNPSTTPTSGTATMNGGMQMTATGSSMTIVANQFAMSYTNDGTTDSSTMNGGLALSSTSSGVTQGFSVTFTNLQQATEIATGAYSLNGGITIASTPASCADGTFQFTTSSPIQVDVSGNPVGGTLTINGSTVTYNPDGSVTVDGTTYSGSQLLAQYCPV